MGEYKSLIRLKSQDGYDIVLPITSSECVVIDTSTGENLHDILVSIDTLLTGFNSRINRLENKGIFSVVYKQVSTWDRGATIEITIINNDTKPVNDWVLQFPYSGNQLINNSWNCKYTQVGSYVTLRNESYNSLLEANGGSVTIGFNISFSGSNNDPTEFFVNTYEANNQIEAITVKTTDYTLLSSDKKVFFNSKNKNLIATLPNASLIPDKEYVIKNIGSKKVTINTTNSQLIDNTSSITLNKFNTIKVISYGNQWYILEYYG